MATEYEIGMRIKLLRKELKLIQEEFGKRLGITGAAVSRIEKGERGLTDQMAKSICREYKADYLWLTKGIGNMFVGIPENLIDEIVVEYDLDDLDRKIIEEYLKLDADTRKSIKAYIQNIFS